MATCSKHGCMLPFISLVSWWLASSLPGCFTFVAAYDPRCAAAAEGVSCNSEDPCRSDCWNNLFTHSYCCVETPCFSWGSWTPSSPMKTELAQSGVVCRYLCQAVPGCTHWTFLIPQDEAGACFMYNTSVPMASPSEELTKVVSGARFCTPEPLSIKTPRSSNLSQERIYQATTDVEEVAAAIQQQGWAVLRGAVPSALLEILKLEVPKAAEQLLHQDPQRIGNRGPRRYSWGGSSTSHHMVHLSSWAQLLDIHQLVQVLENVFQGEYVAIGGGGDFVLGETDSHQRLHVDLQLEAMYDSRSAAAVVANFVLSDISCHDGPVRLVPGTQNLPLASQLGKDWGYATHLQKESQILSEQNLSYIFACPLRPGDILLRDMRLWHGGSPNLGKGARYLPSAEFLSLRYAEATRQVPLDHFSPRPALAFASWLRFSPATQRRAREILSIAKLNVTVRPEFLLMLPYVAEERP